MSDTTTTPRPVIAGSRGHRVIHLAPAPGQSPNMGVLEAPAPFESVDVYELPSLDLDTIAGINISSMCDQVFLARHTERLAEFVRGGGRILFSGHAIELFLPGLVRWRKMEYHGAKDLEIVRLAEHPLWDGIDLRDVLYRTGVPGRHSFEELRQIGVAGFYGRGYHVRLPEGATAINGIGPLKATIDYEYSIGEGRVLVHGGLDLLAFVNPAASTADLATRIVLWLKGES